MGRSSRRRSHKRQKRLASMAENDGVGMPRQLGELLRQWALEAGRRSGQLRDGRKPSPGVWEFFEAKRCEAKAYGIEEDLALVCSDAITRQMRTRHGDFSRIKTRKLWLAALLRPRR